MFISHPCEWVPVSNLRAPAWVTHHQRFNPTLDSLNQFYCWLTDNYDESVHRDILELVTDTRLLLETAKYICCGDPPEEHVQEF